MKKKKNLIGYSTAIAMVAISVAVFSSGNALAEFGSRNMERDGQNRQMRDGDRQGGPFRSTESVSACESKSEGDSCSFSMTPPNGDDAVTVEGTCSKAPARQGQDDDTESDTLSCMPARNELMKNAPDGAKITSQNRLERAEAMRERAASRITATQTRLSNIVSFLQSKDVDTSSIESEIDTLKEKTDTVLDKYDALTTLLGEDDPSSDDVQAAFEAVRSAEKAARDYFTGTLRTAIRSALDSL